ncbi:MAG TPA: M23 family metallopeptidase [Prolixibacteraceae bacterium]
MFHKYTLIFTFFLLSQALTGQVKYSPPLKGPFSFSGDFGELRRNHFHTGLDFRTGGQIGVPVLAVSDGMVARVAVSPYGYGHALYIMHPDGQTTVYGHLSRFHPKIEAYVVSQQYLKKQFAVDLTVPQGLITFKKGEVIAWSGSSGSSGGPHLHFEIRDTKSEKPQNPLFYLPGIPDKSSPRINGLYLYFVTGNSQITGNTYKQRIEIVSSAKTSTLKNKQPIEVFGDIGIGIQSDDDFNGTGIRCGIYSVELFLDQHPVFSFQLDHLAFDQGRYVNSHIDYEEMIRNKRWIHKLFLQPGNKMEIYRTTADRGVLKLSDGKAHTVKIIVSDAFKNTNTLTFSLLSKKKPLPVSKSIPQNTFFFDRPNEFEAAGVKIQLPEGTLYDNLDFAYYVKPVSGSFLSAIHQIHNQYIAVHIPYSLSIAIKKIPSRLQSKALMVSVSPTGKLSPVGGSYENSWVTAHPRVFGDFAVALDTIPPAIRPLSIKDHSILTNRTRIEFKITDNLSGIDSYEGEIDGSWVLFEYDAKTDNLFYIIDKERLTLGKRHTLRLRVNDERKNQAEYQANFYD